jgi:hypothetical protein
MPSRHYTVNGPREIRYSLMTPEAYQPNLYLAGNGVAGFHTTAAPPEIGFWGVSFRDKAVNAATIESGNATTWVLNNLIDPLVPGEQRFVSLGAGNLMRQQFEGEQEVDGWRALSNRLSPVQNVAEFDKRLTFKDHDFDANAAVAEWMEDGGNQVLARLAEREGFDLPGMLGDARNLDHFVYLQNRILTHARAMQNIREWEEKTPWYGEATSSIYSGVFNYLLTDPSFAPSLVVGPGALNAAGKSVAVGARTIRLSAPVLGARAGIVAGRTAAALAKAPAAVHAGLAAKIGYRAAVTVELGAYGGAWDAAIQRQRMAESDILFDSPEFQQNWSWAEFGLATGLSASLGFALAGRAGGRTSRSQREIRRSVTEAAGGSPSSPVAYSFNNLPAQLRVDGATIRAQRAAERILGDDFDVVAPYLLDDAYLTEAGLHRFQVTEVLEEMAEALDGEALSGDAVQTVLTDLFREARRVRGLRSELTDSASTQLEQAALAEALGRAARELPPEASNEDVLRRAATGMKEELEKIEKRMQDMAAQARPARETDADFWKAEGRALREAAQRRRLTEAELDYMARVDGKLQSLGQKSVFEGWAANRAQRYLDGTAFAPFRARQGSDLTKAVQKVATERRNVAQLTRMRDFGEDVVTDLKNARERLKRAQASLKKAARRVDEGQPETVDQARVREVMEKWQAKPPRNRAEFFRAYDDMARAVDFNQNALIEDAAGLETLLKSMGLSNRAFRTIASSGTGMNQTVRSTLGVLREIANEFDNSKLRVGHLDPNSRTVQRTMEDVRMDIARRQSLLVDEVRKLQVKGKFGGGFNVMKIRKQRAEFERAVIRHIAGETSSDPDVIRLANIWKQMADEIGDIAEATGQFPKVANFFPRRWHIGVIGKNPEAFRTDLANFFLKKWRNEDEIFLGALDEDGVIGVLRRDVDDDGWRTVWRRTDNNEIVEEGKLTRANLEQELGVKVDDYLAALTTVGGDGLTPMQRSAQRAINNLHGDDAIEESAGRIRIKRHGAPQSERARRFEEEVWTDKSLEKYLDWSFLDNASHYLSGTGFRVLNVARHQDRWGIPGTNMHIALDWLQARIPAGASQADRKAWEAGIESMREKLHLAEGRLPTIRDHTNRLGEYLGDLGTSMAGALYGSGIGQTILTTEVMGRILSGVYNIDDIPRKLTHIFRAVRQGSEMREMVQTLGLTIQQYRQHTLDRLTGGAVHSTGINFGIPKLIAPFIDVFDSATVPMPQFGGKLANAPVAVLRAHAGLSMTLGGMDYFTTMARMLHVQSVLDETGRFFRAAEKMADLLPQRAAKLDEIEQAAITRKLAGVDDPTQKQLEAAARAGTRARLKAWKGLAREAGFGSNWQVAERMNRAGLFKPGRLGILRRAGEQTGGLKDTGLFKTVDFNEMMRFSGGTLEEQQAFDDAFRSFRELLSNGVRKRISEQNLLHMPTSKTSRTWYGRVHLAMTSWARSWYDNTIMDAAQMPLHATAGLLLAYLGGETMSRLLREMWHGKDIDDVMADIEDDPDNFIARSLANLPAMGGWSALLRPAADALTLDGRRQKVDVGESAATGAVASTLDIVFDTVHGVSPLAEDGEIQSHTWRSAARLFPGYRSWWAMGLRDGIRAVGGPDIIEGIEGSRHGRMRAIKGEIPDIPPALEGEVQTGPDIPDDLSFLYTTE